MDQDLTIFLAPFAIVVGGALIAASGLTLFGYHYIYQNIAQAILGVSCQSCTPWRAGALLLCIERIFFRSSRSIGVARMRRLR